MAGLNKVMLIGHLGGDPESKTLDGSGDMVINFSIATSESWKNKQGEKVEDTQWHRIVAWRKLAEVIFKHCKKGDRIYIEGKLTHRSYDDKDGIKRYATEIVAREMVMLGNKKETTEANNTVPTAEPDKKDDLPF